jgi:hypothetical protein
VLAGHKKGPDLKTHHKKKKKKKKKALAGP